MSLIVSDTSPLHYLALIGEVHILPTLYGHIIIPQKVYDEMRQPNTPAAVKAVVASLPSWIEVRTITTPIPATLAHLDIGEQEAITLAMELQADVLLIDETKGRTAAKLHGLKILGILGLLYDAADANLSDLKNAFDKLKRTNFRATDAL
jgi:predicted nucleic acid-binding protein